MESIRLCKEKKNTMKWGKGRRQRRIGPRRKPHYRAGDPGVLPSWQDVWECVVKGIKDRQDSKPKLRTAFS